jgi:hypothetical protein
MARGWESKSIEAQQAERQAPAVPRPHLDAETRRTLERQQAAGLALARVRDELTRAVQPAHRAMLERAAAALEAELTAAT